MFFQLPIKTAAGRLVEQSVEVDEDMNADDGEPDDEEEEGGEENEEDFPKYSTLEQCKIEIANMCTALTSSPERHVSFTAASGIIRSNAT